MEATTSAETYSPDLEKAGISFSPPASTLAWADLVFTVRGRETPILHGISGQVSSGELLAGEHSVGSRLGVVSSSWRLAVMGPSVRPACA